MKRKYFRKNSPDTPAEETGEAAVETLEETPTEAGEAPAATKKPRLIKRVAYKGLYGVAYGTVFTSLLLRKLLVPKGSLVEEALHDGAVAAQHDFEEKEKIVEEAFKEAHEETAQILAVEELPAAAG